MGSCSSIYIEFKKRGDQQWYLLEGIVPLDYRDRSYCGEDDSHDSNHAVEIGGVKMCRMFNIVRQGDVRDLLAGHDAPFNDRGFPDDLSPELQSYLDERLEKCKASILSEHSKQLSYGISDKLDAILAAVSGKAMKPKKGRVDEEYIDQGEMLDFYMGEELNEILWLREFASGLGLVYEFLTDEWFSEKSLRLEFYSC